MNGDRHHSWQQLKFLKQAYKKNAKYERGGNTMDVLNASKFTLPDPKEFDEHYRNRMRSLTESLNDQQKNLTKVFMQSLFSAAEKRKLDFASPKPVVGALTLSKIGKNILTSTESSSDSLRLKRAILQAEVDDISEHLSPTRKRRYRHPKRYTAARGRDAYLRSRSRTNYSEAFGEDAPSSTFISTHRKAKSSARPAKADGYVGFGGKVDARRTRMHMSRYAEAVSRSPELRRVGH